MGKKYIIIAGQKHFIPDEDLKDEDNDPTPETPAADAPVGDEAAVDKKANDLVKKMTDDITSKVVAALGANGSLDKKVESQVNSNSKLFEILNGKDLFKDKDKLTKEEKIVAYYHACATKNDLVLKALSEGTNADGGYLVPTELRAEIVRYLADTNRMRSEVRVVPMRNKTLTAPSLVNGVKVYWAAENASKTTTSAEFGVITLTAYKVAAILYTSDELVEDATNFDMVQIIIGLFGEAIATEEDRVIIAGAGTTEPKGIITSSITKSQVCSGNLSFDNMLKLVHKLHVKYRSAAKFIINPENILELRMLKDSDGRYLWADPVNQGQSPTLMGYPVIESEWMSVAKITFGNYKLGYWLGDRKQMTVKISQDTETAFTKDQTAVRVVERLGGDVVLGEAIAVLTTIP